MDPLAKIARALDAQERRASRKSLEDAQERCRELLKTRSGVLLTKQWKRQHFIGGESRDLPASYVVSGTGVSRSFESQEEATGFFVETARRHGRQRRREWWREWWPSVFVAAVILAFVQQGSSGSLNSFARCPGVAPRSDAQVGGPTVPVRAPGRGFSAPRSTSDGCHRELARHDHAAGRAFGSGGLGCPHPAVIRILDRMTNRGCDAWRGERGGPGADEARPDARSRER